MLESVENYDYQFKGARAQLFKEALIEYPKARRDDLSLMRKHLSPQPGERILGFGEGNGYFCRAIAEAVGKTGSYVITEASPELICGIPESVLALPQVQTKVMPAESLEFASETFDKVWACGAFHHCPDQTEAMKRMYRVLKPGGRLVIFDVFQGTPLAEHFDAVVARYCETGHEAKFMSETFARTLCFLAGFADRNVQIVEIPHRFVFDSEEDIGKFVYKLHALTLLPGNYAQQLAATVKGLRDYLTIEREGSQYILHWNQRGLIATK
jgi:ubiquinone/menaquinone biosynthesis C-methylase UbiE